MVAQATRGLPRVLMERPVVRNPFVPRVRFAARSVADSIAVMQNDET